MTQIPQFTRLPQQVSNWLQVLRLMFPHRHHVVFCWVPLEELGWCRTCWTYMKRARLRQSGDVTLVLRTQWRNAGPKQTTLLLTKLPEATARQVVDVSRRRWSLEPRV